MMEVNSGRGKKLLCTLCPPPGRFFKRPSGLAVHLKHAHSLEGRKTFFCSSCNQTLRSQVEQDAHTKRHANQDAVFTCCLCPEAGEGGGPGGEGGGPGGEGAVGGGPGSKGARWGLKWHLQKDSSYWPLA